MRSSLSGVRSNQMLSQVAGVSSMSLIKNNNNIISKDSKFLVLDEMPNLNKFFGNIPLSEKDELDMKRKGLSFRKFENGDIFYGHTEFEKPHGLGLYVFWSILSDKKPYFYLGNFQNGSYSGFGKLCLMMNEKQALYCYQGNWKLGKRQGDGRQNYNADSTMYYKGNWVNDLREGHGIFVMPDGGYDGLWHEGKMSGEGTLTLERGSFKTVINGQWMENQITQGVIQYYSKMNNQLISQYKGGIRNLLREGEGTYTIGNTEVQAIFRNDEVVGDCTIRQQNKDAEYSIKGDFNRPQLVGLQAKINYKNNDAYQGLVDITPNHIVRRTKGKYFYSNGECQDGEFEDNDRGELIMKK